MKKVSFRFLFAFVLSVTGPLCFGFGKILSASKDEAVTAENKLEQSLGSRAGQLEIERITKELYTKLNEVDRKNKALKNELQSLKSQYPTEGQRNLNQVRETGRSLLKKINKPPGWNAGQYDNATPNQIKKAWRDYHEKRRRQQMENSR